MQAGISTASLFGRYTTEDALKTLAKNRVECAEIFLESYCEYTKKFGKKLKKVKGDTLIHSIHTLTTQFEPQLYSINERAQADSFMLLNNVLSCGKKIGAKYYTFHGGARYKRAPLVIDFDRVGAITQKIIEECNKFGIKLAYENVHWSYYNYVGFFNELKKKTSGLKGTLDIKQARQSGVDYREFLKEMGADIATVHLSDVDKNGNMCLPGKGQTDFYQMFSLLSDYNFDGALLLEVYKNDYSDLSELLESLEFIKYTASKVW